MSNDLATRLDRLMPLVRQASEIALNNFGRVSGHTKYDGSIVTEADSLTERFIVDGLKQRFPGETIIGEELGESQGNSRYVWSIDPIDGTAAYACRMPYWCVSIGLMVDRQPVLGVVALPALQEIYWAYQGGGAYMQSERWGKEQIKVTSLTRNAMDKNATICVPSTLHHHYQLDHEGKQRSLGSTAIHALLVARGDAIGAIMRPFQWDIAGALPILLEAGGRIEAVDNGRVDVQSMLPGSNPPYLILSAPQFSDYLRQSLQAVNIPTATMGNLGWSH